MSNPVANVTFEVKLDHERTCENCGKMFPVIFRQYVVSDITASKVVQELVDAGGKIAQIKQDQPHLAHLQRCTWCGRYEPKVMSDLTNSYPAYRRQCHVAMGCLAVVFLALGAVLVWWLLLPRGHGDPIVGKVLGGLFLVVTAGIAIRAAGPLSPEKFHHQIACANSAATAEEWLRHWQNQSSKPMMTLQSDKDVACRKQAWMELVRIKNHLAPKHGLNEPPIEVKP